MAKHGRFLAFDLGAESGRAVVGTLANHHLSLELIHRFANMPVELGGTLYWDILSLHRGLLDGIRTYVGRFGEAVDAIGIDTWGVDFGLISSGGELISNPVHYRDRRTDKMPDYVRERLPEARLYEDTGIALLPIYTLCQMLSLRLGRGRLLDMADTFLMMPDLLGYFLTGKKVCERTNAATTQLYDPRRGQWHEGILSTFDLPHSIMPDLIDPGTILGDVCESVRRDTGLKHGVIVAPCTHDTILTSPLRAFDKFRIRIDIPSTFP